MKKIAALLALALAAVALVACGGDDETTATGKAGGGTTTEDGSDSGGPTLEFKVKRGKGVAYTTTEASTEAGNVKVTFKNPQSYGHDVVIEDAKGKTVGKTAFISADSTSTSIELEPGEYTFYCSINRKEGMEGTLTVE
jgi:plastocyanin